MDNFFTSLCLLKFLASNNIRASGTVRENRFGNCTITKNRQINNSNVVKWIVELPQEINLPKSDGKTTSQCILCGIVIQVNPCQLYKDGVKIPKLILQSHNHLHHVIDQYNKGMGRVSRANQNIVTYRLRIKTRK